MDVADRMGAFNQAKEFALKNGKIQLQAEAAELFFKEIRIRKIDALSKGHQKLF